MKRSKFAEERIIAILCKQETGMAKADFRRNFPPRMSAKVNGFGR